MIVRDKPAGLRLFFVLRGSIIKNIAPRLILTILLSCGVLWTEGKVFGVRIDITPAPFTLIGLALAIFLGFRNSASYERFSEGRKLWGEMINVSRNLARQTLSFVQHDPALNNRGDLDQLPVRMVYRIIAFAEAAKARFRNTDCADHIRPLLREDEWEKVLQAPNVSVRLLHNMGLDLGQALRDGKVQPNCAQEIDESINRLMTAYTGCERISNTPIPFSYAVLLHRTVYMYCLLLPFGLSQSVGLLTPVVVGIVAYTFFGLDEIGNEIEEPFGTDPNDLPLNAMTRTIEIELREMLGETSLPAPLRPIDYVLS